MKEHRRAEWIVPTLVLLSTIFAPLAYVHWTSMWLEFFGRWLFFIWFFWDIWTYRIGFFDYRFYPFDFGITLGLSLAWIILGVILSVALYRNITKSQYARSLFVSFCTLILQILLPLLVFSIITDSSVFVSFILPLPIPSIIALLFLIYDVNILALIRSKSSPSPEV